MTSLKKRVSLVTIIGEAEKKVKKVKNIEKSEPTDGVGKEIFDRIKKNFVAKY